MGYYIDKMNEKRNAQLNSIGGGSFNNTSNNNNNTDKNIIVNSNESDKNLEQIRLIKPTENGLKRIKNTQKLVTVKQFNNENGEVKKKGQGVRISWPIFYKSYIVEMERYTVNVRDKNSTDGRYSQDVGIGDDVTLRLKVTFKVKDDEASLQQLLKNETTHLSAIRDAAEQIMRLTLKEKYDPKHVQEPYVDIEEIRVLKNLDKKSKSIFDIASDLEQNYGIILEKVKFSDIDKSEKQKELEREISNQEKIRENELKNAQNRVDIAAKDKEAQILKNEGKIDLYKKLREEVQVSPDKIGDIELVEKMPKSTIFMYGNSENRPLSSEILAAKKVYDEIETETKVEKIKKK